MNLVDLFRISFAEHGDKIALRFGDCALSFLQLDRLSNRWARVLAARGLCKGDRVACYLSNSVELVLLYLANLKLGLVTVPMNTQYRDVEVEHIVADAGPRVLVTDRAQQPILQTMAGRLGAVEQLVLVEDLAAMIEMQSEADIAARVDGDDLAAIMYTSGTTGRSKGAMLTHGNFVSNITGLLAAWHWTASDTLLIALPLFHVHGLGVALQGSLAAASTLVLNRSFDAGRVLDDLIGGDISVMMGVPTMYVRLLQEVDRRGLAHVSLPNMRLFVSGSAPLSTETFRAFEERFGHAILERYGMTETVMNLSNLYAGPRVPGTVGVPLPGVSARIADDSGNTIRDGEIGHVLISGSNVFHGYWGLADKTAQAFFVDSDGIRWFRTGDLGRRDAVSGYITLVGRAHDLIISGGYNIYPREIEEHLMRHPAVLDAAVVGTREEARGEIPVAFVVLKATEAAQERELIEFCEAHLARYKVPWHIAFLDALPRNAMGKLDKKTLSARAAELGKNIDDRSKS